MRNLIAGAAVVIAGLIAVFAIAALDNPASYDAGPPAPVDFSGRWKLAEQETKARGGQGALGNHEEPVTIAQSGNRLSIEVESADPAGCFAYDTSGRALESTPPGGKTMVTAASAARMRP